MSQDPDCHDPRAVLWLCPDCGQLEGRVAERYGGGRYVYAMAPRPAGVGAAAREPDRPRPMLLLTGPEGSLRAVDHGNTFKLAVEGVLPGVGFATLQVTLALDQADKLACFLPPRSDD